MKNLFLSAALMLAFAASAQVQDTISNTAPATDATMVAGQEKEYIKVSQSQIAPAVLKEAVTKYKDYSLVEALVAKDGSDYKLVLTKDGKDVAAFYSSTGEFIKEETV
jgi:hypothetical protein